ncbi:MAG: hypothetical protein JSS43_13540 [Proteobacteria bacterium]|nr:hypothetical protein [Pseudomonadota bacterium]
MTIGTRLSGLSIAMGLIFGGAALAQQQAAPNSQNMPMHGHDMGNMGNMNMQDMMTHCAQMRQQAKAGTAMTPDMRNMMAQCDQMDRQMGTQGGPPAPQNRTR